jgi:hypothetical protein
LQDMVWKTFGRNEHLKQISSGSVQERVSSIISYSEVLFEFYRLVNAEPSSVAMAS